MMHYLVNFTDSMKMLTLSRCASRFEGDADADGDVDMCDLDILETEMISQTPLRPCTCGQQMASGGGEELFVFTSSELDMLKQHVPVSPDMDGDGDVDEKDIVQLDSAIYGAIAKILAEEEPTSDEIEPGPKALEPEPTPADFPLDVPVQPEAPRL